MPNNSAPYCFCPVCGNPLIELIIDSQPRSHCTDCSYVNWGKFSLGVGGVVWHNNKVLLVQRGYNPGKGMWTIPGGYVDQRESIGDAVVREIQEETGIIAKPLSIVALRDRPDEKHDTYLIFSMQYVGGELSGQPGEVLDLGFFTLEECQTLPIAALTMSALLTSHFATQGLVLSTDVQLNGTLSTLYQIK